MKKVFYQYKIGPNIYEMDDWSHQLFPPDFYEKPIKSLSHADRNYAHAKCPAWKEWHKNTWVVTQQFDLGIEYISEEKRLETNLSQAIFDEYFMLAPDWLDGKYPEIQFKYAHTFWTEEKDVWIEQIGHPEAFRLGLDVIPGTFPISVWTRPVGFGFKLMESDKKIWIPKGTPLYYFKLTSKRSDSLFSIEQKNLPLHIIHKQRQDLDLKEYQKNISWDLIKKRLQKEEQSKCPFNFLWKK